jgi:hypothetical protein
MKNQVLSIVALAFSISVAAQKVTASVDRQEILIGEQIKLRLQANFLKGEPLLWFDGIDTIAHFEILDKSAVDTLQMQENGVALSQTLTLTSWDSGKILLPSFAIAKWKTKPIPVNVAYSPHPFDTTKPYNDIKEILEVKKPIKVTWYWYLIFALVIIGLFLLFFPRAKKKADNEFVPDEGAFKKALKQLDQLKASDAADAKAYYTEMIRIFRHYLHRRRNIYSFSKTTDDLSVQMQQLNMDREHYADLVQALRLSDLVKFARYQPSRAENEIAIDTVKQSIITIENLPNAVRPS